MNKHNRIVLLLAAYDYESLHITLESLSHTLDDDEKVVIILNGKRGIRSALVEDVAREWCNESKNRCVVKPLNYGNDAYTSICEVIEKFPLFENVEFICKIDDDLIPLRKGWVDNLHRAYVELEKEHNEIGFVTSLINNNSWGFKKLIEIYNKQEEYKEIMNFDSHSGTGIVKAKKIGDGNLGSVWQYPYLAKWIHSWTMYDVDKFIQKTKDLGVEEIELNTHYSIGCLFFRKELWTSLPVLNNSSNFDELLIHQYCKKFSLRKFSVMNEPMGHLFYYVQRIPNRMILPKIRESLSAYWNNAKFCREFNFDMATTMEIVLENPLLENSQKLVNVIYDLEVIRKSSFYYKLRNLYHRQKNLFSGRKAEHKADTSKEIHPSLNTLAQVTKIKSPKKVNT